MTAPTPRSWLLTRADRDFAAYEDALAALRAAGFGVGAMQGDDPAGLRFGASYIAKWRNLSDTACETLHGVLSGSPRFGPVRIDLHDACPPEAALALARALATIPSAAPDAPAPLTIGEAVVKFDVTPRTLRFWEYRELIAPIRDGQRRLYPAPVLARIERIVQLKAMGFALEEIRGLLDLEAAGDAGVPLATRITMLRERAARLEDEQDRAERAHDLVVEELRALKVADEADEAPAEPRPVLIEGEAHAWPA